jgi:hypothetical protein
LERCGAADAGLPTAKRGPAGRHFETVKTSQIPPPAVVRLAQCQAASMSGDGSVAAWPKRPRPSSTLPKLPIAALRHHLGDDERRAIYEALKGQQAGSAFNAHADVRRCRVYVQCEVVAKHRQGQPRKSGARLSKEKEIVGQRIASVIITTVTATCRRTTPRHASGLRRPLTKGFDWQGTIYSRRGPQNYVRSREPHSQSRLESQLANPGVKGSRANSGGIVAIVPPETKASRNGPRRSPGVLY